MVVKLYTANFAVSKNNKNKCKMKKIIVLAMMFSVTFFNRATANKAEDSSSPKKIEIVTDNSLNNENEYERNLNYPIIDALLYSDIKQVEVTLYNIGKTEIYIDRLNLKNKKKVNYCSHYKNNLADLLPYFYKHQYILQK